MNLTYSITTSMNRTAERPFFSTNAGRQFRMSIVTIAIIAAATLMVVWTAQQVSAGEQVDLSSAIAGSTSESDVTSRYSEWQINLLEWELKVENLNSTSTSQGPLFYLPQQFGGYHSNLG